MSKKSSWRIPKPTNINTKINPKRKSFIPNDTFFNEAKKNSHKSRKERGNPSRNQKIPNSQRKRNNNNHSIKSNTSALYDITPLRSTRRITSGTSNFDYSNIFSGEKSSKNLESHKNRRKNFLFKENRVDRNWNSGSRESELGSPSIDSSCDNNKSYNRSINDIKKNSNFGYNDDYKRRPNSKENNYYHNEEPNNQFQRPPCNPWLEDSSKKNIIKKNLNNTSFHIYPTNRKRSKSLLINSPFLQNRRIMVIITTHIKQSGNR